MLDVALAVAVVVAAGLRHVFEVFLRQPGGHGLHVGVGGQQVLLALQAVAELAGQAEDFLHTHLGLAQTVELVVDAVQQMVGLVLKLSASCSCTHQHININININDRHQHNDQH